MIYFVNVFLFGGKNPKKIVRDKEKKKQKLSPFMYELQAKVEFEKDRQKQEWWCHSSQTNNNGNMVAAEILSVVRVIFDKNVKVLASILTTGGVAKWRSWV